MSEEAILKQYMPAIAKYAARGAFEIEFEDRVSIGKIAALKAIRTFDPAKGVKLITWIIANIRNALIEESRREVSRTGLKRSMKAKGVPRIQVLAMTPEVEAIAPCLSRVISETDDRLTIELAVNQMKPRERRLFREFVAKEGRMADVEFEGLSETRKWQLLHRCREAFVA